MDKYYYFVAQLPMLFFGRETNMSMDYFLAEAEKWLSAKDFRLLSQVDINDFSLAGKFPPTLLNYKRFESSLRDDIFNWRLAKQNNQDYKPVSFPVSVIKEGNPLEIELKLMKLKWDFIDEMEHEHHFDLGFIILYYLKLQILRRLFTFNKEKGLEKFQKLYEVNI